MARRTRPGGMRLNGRGDAVRPLLDVVGPVVSQRSPLGMTDFAPLAGLWGSFFVAAICGISLILFLPPLWPATALLAVPFWRARFDSGLVLDHSLRGLYLFLHTARAAASARSTGQSRLPSSHPISLSLQIDGRLRYGLGVVRLLRPTGGMVPSAPDAWPSRVVAPTPGPVFIQDQSASGKRDSSAQRQTSQKSPPGQKRSPRRPKSSRKCPPIAGFLAVSGNLAVRKSAWWT